MATPTNDKPIQQHTGKPELGVMRTISDGGFIGRPPARTTPAPTRTATDKPASAKLGAPKPDPEAEKRRAAIAAEIQRQLAADKGTPSIRDSQRRLLAQVAGIRVEDVGKLAHRE